MFTIGNARKACSSSRVFLFTKNCIIVIPNILSLFVHLQLAVKKVVSNSSRLGDFVARLVYSNPCLLDRQVKCFGEILSHKLCSRVVQPSLGKLEN